MACGYPQFTTFVRQTGSLLAAEATILASSPAHPYSDMLYLITLYYLRLLKTLANDNIISGEHKCNPSFFFKRAWVNPQFINFVKQIGSLPSAKAAVLFGSTTHCSLDTSYTDTLP